MKQLLKRYLPASTGPALAYVRLRTKALRVKLAERNEPGDSIPYPLPPPLLRFRVHGALEQGGFIRKGQACNRDIRALLESVGRDLSSFNHILDFGCGCGRVLRYFHDRPASCQLSGTDIDSESIAWCATNLKLATFKVNEAMPPTSYAADTFDLIYAISVFTHLDEEMQFAWLRELKRISRPGGMLILTIHGEFAQATVQESIKAQIAETGFAFQVGQTGRFKLDGLPDFYQTAYHSKAYIYEKWSQFFRIEKYAERGISGFQDAVILINP